MIVGIDHILIAVEDVDRAMGDFKRLGFLAVRGGAHPRWGTHNALVPLADGSYFELIGVNNPALATQSRSGRNVKQTLERDNRLAGFALESDDLDGDVAAIRKRGIEIGDPEEGSRSRPDGHQVRWRSARCADELLPFLIRDATSRELRVPSPIEGIGHGLHLSSVTIGARDIETTRAKFRKLLGVDAPAQMNLARGGIRIETSERDEMLRVTCWADQAAPILEYWRTRDVPFSQDEREGKTVLTPLETLGAPIGIMIGNPNLT